MSDVDVLMSLPRGSHTVVGSTDYDCEDCGTKVAVAPSSVKMLREKPGMIVVCPPCMKKRVENDPNQEVVPPNLDQLAEIATHMRRN